MTYCSYDPRVAGFAQTPNSPGRADCAVARQSMLEQQMPELQHQLADQFLLTVNAQLFAQGYSLKEGTAVDAASSRAQLNEGAKR